jgi:hypothetical protein
MAEHPKHLDSFEKEIEGLNRTEKRILSAQRAARRTQEITNLLMVAATVLMAVATAFSALASWRMARVATDIFQASERPYVGVESIRLDANNPSGPTSWVVFKNFGSVPADRTVIDVSTSIDGHLVTGGLGEQHVVMSLGVLTPETTYLFGALFPRNYASAVVTGKSRIVVSVRAHYRDAPGKHYCFQMDYIYYWPLKKYDPAGGSNRCTGDMPNYSNETTLAAKMAEGLH